MVDLHVHSCFSDGSDSPEALVRLGKDAGLSAMSLTDHDSTRGTERFHAAAQHVGIRTTPGVELSIELDAEREIHILGYDFDLHDATLQDYLASFRAARTKRNKEMVAKVGALGFPLDYDAIVRDAGDADCVGRMHLATAMVQAGFTQNKREAFEKYFGVGKPAFVSRFRMTPVEAVRLIRDANGFPVVAHPQLIGISLVAQRALYKELKAHGLYGIEAYHSEQNKYMTRHFLAMAKDLGLRVTGGSDYHGTFKPSVRIGVGLGELRAPDECFTQFFQCAQTRMSALP